MADDDDPPAPSSYSSCTARVTPEMVAACPGQGVINLETDGVREKVEAAIAEVLYMFDLATKFTFRGPCTSTIQPLGAEGACGCGTPGRDEILAQIWPAWLPPAIPYVRERAGENGGPVIAHCWYAALCGDQLESIRLPWLPVRSVTEIRIGGEVLAADKWRHVPGTNLVLRTDGEGFPTTQNLTKNPGEAGTWTVTFEHGWDLPPGIDRRLASAAAIISSYCLGLPCTLPEGVKISSKGDEQYVVVIDYRKDGLTGFDPIDDWIMVWRKGTNNEGPTVKPRMTRPGGRKAGAVRASAWPV